ncbi:hypothetical protein COCSADRAFT_345266 [Bipolaris sorokiniana ND90Pr]|uniref:Uncharacterized protein n=1 Tax=Cochliobolus sativus (strain ND90Pr / ATCC 201652) TaxID=665912 RepID=M2SFE1_COCSN|nr:uncharacterized protein COCSADRAFT_345266 [Bipolaris sorokiniana ND90Pr]EMD61140.1 hypothetical protein COCSADRAFT_345266 [Bipolaris sorokiniana ND90Pr]
MAKLDEEYLPTINRLRFLCAGLFTIDEESNIIRLVHYTTQEYFERIGDKWKPNAQFHIVSTCLTYLSFDVFKTGSCSSDEEFEERLQENKFLDYATKHWSERAAMAEGEVSELACSFLSDNELVSSAIQALLTDRNRYRSHHSQAHPKESTGLHLAAQLGLSLVLEAMLPEQKEERSNTPRKKDGDDQDSLYIASSAGHNRTVELLLNKGAEPNARNGRYGRAILAASMIGHEEIVEMLLEKGAEINARGGVYGDALTAAHAGRHHTVENLLVQNGAKIVLEGKGDNRYSYWYDYFSEDTEKPKWLKMGSK